MRTLSIGGRIVRVAVREGNPDWPPLLLCNGIGASLELFQPFVDALDPQRGVIRFDMPGIGGSPAPVVPYHVFTLPSLLGGLLDQLGYEQADVLGISWGGGLAQQFAAELPGPGAPPGAVATGPGALMVPRASPRPAAHAHAAAHRDPGHAARIAGELYGGSVRETRRWPVTCCTPRPPGPVHGLLLPAALQHRLDQPAAAAAAAAAHPDPGGRRRPDHPADQRADHALADTAQRAARLSRRPPRAGHGRGTHGTDRGGIPHRRREPSVTQVASAHLGESLGTDFFSVREQFTDEQWEHFITVRRFVDEEVVPVVGPYWERAEICWPLVKRLPELGIVGEDIKGYGCAGMSPMACGLVTMELHRGDGSLGVFLGVHAGLAMLSIAMCGSEEQKARWLPDMAQMNKLGAFALTEPEHGSDSVALETSARQGRGRLGAERPQAVDRPGERGQPGRRLGPQHRGRPGQRVRRGEGIAGLPGPGHRGKGVAALGVAGRDHAGERAGAGREPAARGSLVQGHHPGPGHHPEHLRLGGAGPRHRRLRRRLAVRAGAAPVRRAAGQLPDHPAAAGVDAGGPDRDAAVLPADRPPGRGGG